MQFDFSGVLTHAWQVTWKHALITIVIYFGRTILIGLLMFPFMIPFFALIFSNVNSEENFRNVMWIAIGFSVLFTPVMILVQGIAMTYLKSALMVTYLRLTRGMESRAELQEAAA